MTIEFCGSYSYTLFISFSYLFSHSFLVAYYIIIIINVSNKKKNYDNLANMASYLADLCHEYVHTHAPIKTVVTYSRRR